MISPILCGNAFTKRSLTPRESQGVYWEEAEMNFRRLALLLTLSIFALLAIVFLRPAPNLYSPELLEDRPNSVEQVPAREKTNINEADPATRSVDENKPTLPIMAFLTSSTKSSSNGLLTADLTETKQRPYPNDDESEA